MISLLAAILVGWFAMNGHGRLLSNLPTTHERNAQMQLALGFIGFFGLVPAIVIEALRRTEAELREQRNFLQAIFENKLECVKVIGPGGNLVEMNGAGLAMLEVESVEEARAHGVLNFVREDFRKSFVDLTRRALAGESGSLIFPITGRRGTLRWLETHAAALRGAEGGVVSVLGVTRDVSARREAEEALQRARFTVDRSALAMTWVRPDASIADANPAACEMLGYTVEEFRRLRVPDIDPEYRAERWPHHWAELRSKQSITFPSRQRRKDGVIFDVIVSNHHLNFADGELSCAFVEDVSARRQAELSIANLNQRLALAVQGAGYGVWEFGVETGKLIWDERMYALFGHTRATFDGSAGAWRACLHPESRALVDERFADLLGGRPVEDFEFRIVRASDGAERIIEANGFLQRDAEGRPQRLVGLNRDITEQRHADEARRKGEEQLRVIFSAVPGGIVVLDRNLRVIRTNAAAARILGLPENALVGRTVDERRAQEFREDGSPFAPDEIPSAVARRTGRPVRDVVMGVHRPDGGVAWISVNVEPLCDPRGEVTMLVTSFSDITASRALQEQVRQAQKMEVVGQLAGGVAHDFNNILTAMTLNLQMLDLDPQLPAAIRPQLADLQTMAQRAAKLTEQLLLFARRRPMKTEPLELNSGLASVLKLLRRLLGEHVAVNLSLSAEPLWIRADAGMIDQVVMNLCVNARDAMPTGGGLTLETAAVEIGAPVSHRDARPGRFVRLRVSDTGCGMTPEVQAHLFEPFFTTKEVGKGTGLGLATVHGIIHQHHGWVEVESAVGRGSTFSVYLPLAPPAEIVRVETAHSQILGGTGTILLVEDEESVRLVAGVMLRKLGYRVLDARDGPEALAVWAQHGREVDLLITDMVMPRGLTGIDLCEKLRAENPALAVILMSGYNDEILRGEAGRTAGVTLVGKPFEFADFAAVVRKNIGLRRGMEA
jgi:PAS domain S-box-containing protein